MVVHDSEFLSCRFNLSLLAKQVPQIPRILRGQIEAEVVADRYASLFHLKRVATADKTQWRSARELALKLATFETYSFHIIRLKLGNVDNPSTPALLSGLSLWLAGELGLPVSVTKPWTAIMMAEVTLAETWNALESS